MTETQTFRLMRDQALDLEFEGVLLADLTSRYDKPGPRSGVTWDEELGRERWTEVRIYRTTSGKYVTEIIGKSRMRGDATLRTVRVVDKPDDVAGALIIGTNKKKLTNVAVDALNEAAENDPALVVTLVERI